jgi:tRNA-(ms[2]io[6]A)-hydroxylase
VSEHAILASASSPSWVAAALGDLPTLLVDHAHCEKRAASTAVRFLFKYPEWPALLQPVSRLAREELVHFEQVLRELKARGLAYGTLSSANYAAELMKRVRGPSTGARRAAGRPDPVATVDEMLVCALIEARSHERFVRLIADCPDRALADFYASLADAEERHGSLYVELAVDAAGGDEAAVRARLAELAAWEAQVIARPHQPLRMHSGG